jgi:hypothetical protein
MASAKLIGQLTPLLETPKTFRDWSAPLALAKRVMVLGYGFPLVDNLPHGLSIGCASTVFCCAAPVSPIGDERA